MRTKYTHIIIRAALFLLTFVAVGGETVAQTISTPFPSSFRNTRTNTIEGRAHLSPVFPKIRQHKYVKIMHIGDSHVKGNVLPRTVESTLRSYFPRLEFSYYGINGAWAKRFCEADMVRQVADFHPDLVIVSFGTNEAHGSTLDTRTHHDTMQQLVRSISERCPGVCFIFTTPPGSYISQRTARPANGRSRRTRWGSTKVPNANTANVARSIVDFCRNRRLAVWDIFEIAGGATSACSNWQNAGLMNTDFVHYISAGYTLQGKLLAEAIYRAYMDTPTSGSQTRMMHPPTPKQQIPYQSVKGF